jgi:flagellar biosynthesis protein FlhG
VVLVDADLYRADVATLCGLDERGNVADVLSARCDIHEVLQPGPAGIQVVPGLWAPGHPADYSETAQQRLLRQLRTLGPHADVVVLDVGNGGNNVLRRFWQSADDVLLVTTPDSMSVMDSYATIKRLATAEDRLTIRLIVNRASDQHVADDVYRRIDISCQRFLGFRVDGLGYLPTTGCVDAAASAAVPFVISTPQSPATAALERVAAQFDSETAQATPASPSSKQDSIEVDKPRDLTEPHVPFSPIDRKGPVRPAKLT